jgi:hypothetical protein
VKALTIWQPWASLIIAGAKPYEFRRWNYLTRNRDVEGQRIVIHAGARRIVPAEVSDILSRLRGGETGLAVDKARGIVQRALTEPHLFPLAAGLGTAILQRPRPVGQIFTGALDSDRLDHAMWAWPLTDIEPFEPVIPMRGFQGFWPWPKAA